MPPATNNKEFESHIPQVSLKLQIREMSSDQLISYLENVWRDIFNKDTQDFLLRHKSIIDLCNNAYKQLTGKGILLNINDQITEDIKNSK